ncbi:HD-GYP domain-containing protein [Clostridium sp. AF34-13]|uniref:HD-GYP domain-containing protein n=1 Tax=Clostridium sp. AF34-13 TaxID=2293012 RepID=UPI000E4C2088|nr:HD-GYP domain-containing protein [Clostridium sp. AF34-13]RHP25210.1 HD-GYP domain-containing protein [Clostridium sp. AF34-13]
MAAKRILTSRATQNMIVADDVYTSDDKLVIPEGTVLTEDIIDSLKEYGVFAIRIKVDDDGNNAAAENEKVTLAGDEALNEQRQEIKNSAEQEHESFLKQVKESKEFEVFHSAFVDSVDNLKNVFSKVVMHNEQIDGESILSDVENVVSKGRNSIHILDMLQCMRGYDDVTYVHSVNVALLSNMIGRIVYPDISDEELKVLTLAGLLHDIGKMMVPDNIIQKKGRLTLPEYNLVKTHVLFGNNILKGIDNLDPRIAEVAMRHHERCDGTGYPGGYKREQIEPFARIVAIADTYDAMTSDRAYRAAICPFDVIEMFEREGIVKYDVEFLLPFLEKAVQAYMNTNVRLSTNQIGKVIMINKNEFSKPVVQVGDEFYDLSKETNDIVIDKVLI